MEQRPETYVAGPYAAGLPLVHLSSAARALSVGSSAVQSNVQDDILVFGGSGGHEKQPEYVTSEWSVASEFLKSKPSSVTILKVKTASLSTEQPSMRLSDGLTERGTCRTNTPNLDCR